MDSYLISIHALLAESDRGESDPRHSPDNFYPRSPCGERQANNQQEQQAQHISIHALLAESDRLEVYKRHYLAISIHALLAESDPEVIKNSTAFSDFYPRSPCGERPLANIRNTLSPVFLSTLSLRRATPPNRKTGRLLPFLSTLSLRRATSPGPNRKN